MIEIVLGTHRCPFRDWTPEQGRVFGGLFAYDVETTRFDDRVYLTPSLVLATACDGGRGCFVPRDLVPAFFAAHAGQGFIAHNAAFDLKVTQAVLGDRLDLYDLVDEGKIWDTLILKRLLSLATAGHTARNECGLDDCAKAHLGLELPKDVKDADGCDVRTGFGRYLGRPSREIPEEHLRYAAGDSLATWHLFWELNRLIKVVLQDASGVWGYVDDAWLRDAIRRFGPLTHHIQLRASIVTDVLSATGVALDAARGAEKLARVREVMDGAKERMRRGGYLVDQPGNVKAMQSILARFRREHPGAELCLTESGERFSTTAEDLAGLAADDDFFADYAAYREAEKLVSTFLAKMGQPRIYPKFSFLMETGRTSCSGFNLQNLPRAKGGEGVADTIRGCFVPGEGMVFIGSDYSQIELVILGYALDRQFGLGTSLRDLVNEGDVHRLIAAVVLGKEPGEVARPERDSAKPVSFGRPGGMGAERLRRVAKASYGKDLTLEEVQGRIDAYHKLCPELDAYLEDEVDGSRVLAEALDLTPARYREALGGYYARDDPENFTPQGWVAGMLLKVLRDPDPTTKGPAARPYREDEKAALWELAQPLSALLEPKLREKLEGRRPHKLLWEAVRRWAGRRPVFTVTGRLRAHATFSSSRNCVFQGAAADGAILGLWKVWRAGHELAGFVHDEVVSRSPADDRVPDRAAEIQGLMKQGMLTIAPGMVVKVETVVTRSLNKADLDPRYLPEAPVEGPAVATAPAGRAPGADVSGRGTGSPATSP
ncbi:DNA polymerase [Paludisphaera mucosa]|uniref:DNA polymerase I n=1 Tax=Paludisphaera mucosa TaxID=3030827 RepID=A0ABT6FEA1_9BACT|nr:DNA polymerase [Paludisphaera mucosa]MDG3005904.1 DNA polymerase [Paludisphaera mucosa]